MRYSRFIQHDLIGLTRADEWWEYKLVPILSTFYATALVLHVAVSSLWASALSLLLGIVPAAIYASVINDVTDLAGDLEAGKRNAVAGRSRSMVATLVALTVGAGFLFAWLWRDDARLLSCYVAIWLAFSIYSFSPFRFKERGAVGVVCVAAGEQLPLTQKERLGLIQSGRVLRETINQVEQRIGAASVAPSNGSPKSNGPVIPRSAWQTAKK